MSFLNVEVIVKVNTFIIISRLSEFNLEIGQINLYVEQVVANF